VDTNTLSQDSSHSSPYSSIRSEVSLSDDDVSSSRALSHCPDIPSSNRRRLSVTDLGNISKLPSSLATGPRLHAVSDPLPKPSGCDHLDDWFSANFTSLFEVPPPADANEPDLTMPWEVELFSGYLPLVRHKAGLEERHHSHRTSMFLL